MIARLHPNFVDIVEAYRAAVLAAVSAGCTILDAGCGRGGITRELQGQGYHLIGVDITAEAIEGNEHLGEVIVADLASTPLPSASIDVIVCEWVVEHLEAPDAVFAEFARLLRPGGRAVVMTPNLGHPVVRLTQGTSNRLHQRWKRRLYGIDERDTFPKFYRANTPRRLRAAMAAAGLRERSLTLATNANVFCISPWLLDWDLRWERAADAIGWRWLERLSKTGVVAVFERSAIS